MKTKMLGDLVVLSRHSCPGDRDPPNFTKQNSFQKDEASDSPEMVDTEVIGHTSNLYECIKRKENQKLCFYFILFKNKPVSWLMAHGKSSLLLAAFTLGLGKVGADFLYFNPAESMTVF